MELSGRQKPTVFVLIPCGRLEYTVTLEHNEVDVFHLVASGTYVESRVPLLDEEWGWFYEMHHVWHQWFDQVGRRILDGLNGPGRVALFRAPPTMHPRPAW